MTPTTRVYTPIDSTRFMPGTPVHRWLTHLDEICHQAHLDLVAAPMSRDLLDKILRAWAHDQILHTEIVRLSDHGTPVTVAAFTIPGLVTKAFFSPEVFTETLNRLIGYGWLASRYSPGGPRRYATQIGQPYGEPR